MRKFFIIFFVILVLLQTPVADKYIGKYKITAQAFIKKLFDVEEKPADRFGQNSPRVPSAPAVQSRVASPVDSSSSGSVDRSFGTNYKGQSSGMTGSRGSRY